MNVNNKKICMMKMQSETKKNLFICRKFMKTLDLEAQPEISDYAFDKLMGQFLIPSSKSSPKLMSFKTSTKCENLPIQNENRA